MRYSMRVELTRVCSLNGFQLVMGLYRGHSLFFFECVLPLSALPLLDIWYVFVVVCAFVRAFVCMCIGVLLDYINTYFSSVCVSVCLGDFCVCMCGSVVWNLLVTIFSNNLYLYISRYLCMFVYIYMCVCVCVCVFPPWCFRQRTCLTQGLVYGVFNETWTYSCFLFWMVFTYLFFRNDRPSFFLKYVSLSQLYLPDTSIHVIFDTLCVWLCVCLSGFGIHLKLFFSLCAWMWVLKFFSIYIYIYVCLFPFMCVYESCFIQLCFRFIYNILFNCLLLKSFWDEAS